MKIYGEFFRDETGAITIDWVALTAGILLLGIMVIYAIFNGGVAGLVGDINDTLTAVVTDVDTGATPDLNGIEVASGGDGGGPMVLFDGAPSIPVDSTVSVLDNGDGTTFVNFTDPAGGTVFGTTLPFSSASLLALDGATVSSSTTFTQTDGTVVQLSDFTQVPVITDPT